MDAKIVAFWRIRDFEQKRADWPKVWVKKGGEYEYDVGIIQRNLSALRSR
jgi:hypothetical protein